MLTTQAAWMLVVALSMAVIYELYRATVKAGPSERSVRVGKGEPPDEMARQRVMMLAPRSAAAARGCSGPLWS